MKNTVYIFDGNDWTFTIKEDEPEAEVGVLFHRTFMTRIASLLSELATLSNCSKKQTQEAREIINIIGKKIGAKNDS